MKLVLERENKEELICYNVGALTVSVHIRCGGKVADVKIVDGDKSVFDVEVLGKSLSLGGFSYDG